MRKIKNDGQGFTLLELLVVVLIIGILAAIALPQYQRAKAKAELTQLISIVKPYAEAQERYFMTNGVYATSADNLDIEFQQHPGITCYLAQDFWVYCGSDKLIYVTFLQGIDYLPGQIWCGVRSSVQNDKYDNVCKDMFPQSQDITTVMKNWINVRKGWRVK